MIPSRPITVSPGQAPVEEALLHVVVLGSAHFYFEATPEPGETEKHMAQPPAMPAGLRIKPKARPAALQVYGNTLQTYRMVTYCKTSPW